MVECDKNYHIIIITYLHGNTCHDADIFTGDVLCHVCRSDGFFRYEDMFDMNYSVSSQHFGNISNGNRPNGQRKSVNLVERVV